MNTSRILWISTLASLGLICSCKEKQHIANTSPEPQQSATTNLKNLRAALSTPQGSSAYSDLHHMGAAGFEELLDAFANGEITPDNYISWGYDLETRWPDGPKLIEDFETFQFDRANRDGELAKKLGVYYSKFPQDFLENLKEKGAGGQKVAALAIQNK